MSNNKKPNAVIKVATKKREGSNDRFYHNVGVAWVSSKSIYVKLLPNVSLTEGLIMPSEKDDTLEMNCQRLNVNIVEEVPATENSSSPSRLYHHVGTAFRTNSGYYSLALPEGLALTGQFAAYPPKPKE